MLDRNDTNHTNDTFDETTLNPDDESGMVGALAHARQSVLKRAASLIAGATSLPFAEQFDALPTMSSLLMTSLEELKVAEEELRQQNVQLVAQRTGVDQRVHHYHQLFMHAPLAALVTDSLGTILEANHAAGRLLRRDRAHLEQKPLQALMAAEVRETFRRQLARVSGEDGVADWRMVLTRTGDVPIEVSASVRVIEGVGRTGGPGLYWMLRVLDTQG